MLARTKVLRGRPKIKPKINTFRSVGPSTKRANEKRAQNGDKVTSGDSFFAFFPVCLSAPVSMTRKVREEVRIAEIRA
uniref:Ribosomal protein S12 n=1 Tax=Steinernema glaseri TaxID=37863 RepID=A0A1I8AHZ6_9BILA